MTVLVKLMASALSSVPFAVTAWHIKHMVSFITDFIGEDNKNMASLTFALTQPLLLTSCLRDKLCHNFSVG